MSEPILSEVRDNINIILFNRPERYNSFDYEMIKLLSHILLETASNKDIKGVIITGKGKAFCAGGDLKAIYNSGMSYGRAFYRLASVYHQCINEMRKMPKPVISAINGLAAGGGFSLALASDFRVMEKSAILRQAYTSNGLSIDGGGTYTLPRLVGIARALEIACFDKPVDAEMALNWGLITEVVEDGASLERAISMIHELVGKPLSSFSSVKRLINESFNTPFETQLENERFALSWCADHPNGKEGIEAFIKKRKPRFNNNEY